MTKKTSFVIHIALLLFIYPLLYIQTARSSLGSTDIPNLENGPARTNLPSINEIPSTEPPSTRTVDPLIFSRSLDPLIEYVIMPRYISQDIILYRCFTQYLQGTRDLCIPIPSLLALNHHTLNLFKTHYEDFVGIYVNLYLIPNLSTFSFHIIKDSWKALYCTTKFVKNTKKLITIDLLTHNTGSQPTKDSKVTEQSVKQPSSPAIAESESQNNKKSIGLPFAGSESDKKKVSQNKPTYNAFDFKKYRIKPLQITVFLDEMLNIINNKDLIIQTKEDIKQDLDSIQKIIEKNPTIPFLIQSDLSNYSLNRLETLSTIAQTKIKKEEKDKAVQEDNRDRLIELLKEQDIEIQTALPSERNESEMGSAEQYKSSYIKTLKISLETHERFIKKYNKKITQITEYKLQLDTIGSTIKKIRGSLNQVKGLRPFHDIAKPSQQGNKIKHGLLPEGNKSDTKNAKQNESSYINLSMTVQEAISIINNISTDIHTIHHIAGPDQQDDKNFSCTYTSFKRKFNHDGPGYNNILLLCVLLDSLADYKFELYEYCLMPNNQNSMSINSLNEHILFNRKYYNVYKKLWMDFPLQSTTYINENNISQTDFFKYKDGSKIVINKIQDEHKEIYTWLSCIINMYPILQMPFMKRKKSLIYEPSYYNTKNMLDHFKKSKNYFPFPINFIVFRENLNKHYDIKEIANAINNIPKTDIRFTIKNKENYTPQLKRLVDIYENLSSNYSAPPAKNSEKTDTESVLPQDQNHIAYAEEPCNETKTDLLSKPDYSYIDTTFIVRWYHFEIGDLLTTDTVYIIDLTKPYKLLKSNNYVSSIITPIEKQNVIKTMQDFIKTHKTIPQFIPPTDGKFLLSKKTLIGIKHFKNFYTKPNIDIIKWIQEVHKKDTLTIDSGDDPTFFSKLFKENLFQEDSTTQAEQPSDGNTSDNKSVEHNKSSSPKYNDFIVNLARIFNKTVKLSSFLDYEDLTKFTHLFNNITICPKNDKSIDLIADFLSLIDRDYDIKQEDNLDTMSEPKIDTTSLNNTNVYQNAGNNIIKNNSKIHLVKRGSSSGNNKTILEIDWSEAKTLNVLPSTLNAIIANPALDKLIPDYISFNLENNYRLHSYFTIDKNTLFGPNNDTAKPSLQGNEIEPKSLSEGEKSDMANAKQNESKYILPLNNNVLSCHLMEEILTLRTIPLLYKKLIPQPAEKAVITERLPHKFFGRENSSIETLNAIAPLYNKVEIEVQTNNLQDIISIFEKPLHNTNVFLTFPRQLSCQNHENRIFFNKMVKENRSPTLQFDWNTCQEILLHIDDIDKNAITFIKKIPNKNIIYNIYTDNQSRSDYILMMTFTSDLKVTGLWEIKETDQDKLCLTSSAITALSIINKHLAYNELEMKKLLKKCFPHAQTLHIKVYDSINKKLLNNKLIKLLCPCFSKILIELGRSSSLKSAFKNIINLLTDDQQRKITVSMHDEILFDKWTNTQLHNNNCITIEWPYPNKHIIQLDEKTYQKLCNGSIPFHKIDDNCTISVYGENIYHHVKSYNAQKIKNKIKKNATNKQPSHEDASSKKKVNGSESYYKKRISKFLSAKIGYKKFTIYCVIALSIIFGFKYTISPLCRLLDNAIDYIT